ncbi:DUF2474 family protein [Rouxiella sp. Mn2063]
MKPKIQKMDIGTLPPGKGRLWKKIFWLVLIYGGCILALFAIAQIFRIFM